MPLFIATYDHPDKTGWGKHVLSHIAWLQDRLEDGSLLASGPFNDTTPKSALLVMNAGDRKSLEQIIAADPFSTQGLIENMTIREWDPIFGAFNAQSSLPGQMQVPDSTRR